MKQEIIGFRFGNLEVIDYDSTVNHRRYYKCKCDCGKVVVVSSALLKNGTTRSCGCMRGKKSRDVDIRQEAIEEPFGKSRTILYGVWSGMRNRCNNSNNTNYHRYGGRGIKVCEEWDNSYELFKKWALDNGYGNGLTLDRVDNNKDYGPSNCRWVNMKIQSNNTRKNRILEYKGMGKTLSEWAEYFGVKYSLLTVAHAKGKSYEDILKYYDPTT